jgi:hypothetical protein
MVKESSLVIEYGEESIRNGRKLQKEDFSYFYERPGGDRLSDMSVSMSQQRGLPTEREDSPNSRVYQEIQAKTERFNRLLMAEINREKDKF